MRIFLKNNFNCCSFTNFKSQGTKNLLAITATTVALAALALLGTQYAVLGFLVIGSIYLINKNKNHHLVALSSAKFHGTSLGTLYIMSKLKEADKNCLLPFGDLASKEIPCFVGEHGSGIKDNGINLKGSSWSSSHSVARSYATAKFECSGGGRRTIKDHESLLEGLIEEYQKSYIQKMFAFFNYGKEAFDWRRRALAVCVARSHDDQKFQKELAPNLTLWAKAVIEDIQTRSDKELVVKTVDAAEKFIQSLTKPLYLSAGDDEDRALFNDFTPIIFASTAVREDEAFQPGDSEYIVKRPMKLGTEIQYILTERSAVERVTKHIADQGLAKKVHVVALEILDNFKDFK